MLQLICVAVFFFGLFLAALGGFCALFLGGKIDRLQRQQTALAVQTVDAHLASLLTRQVNLESRVTTVERSAVVVVPSPEKVVVSPDAGQPSAVAVVVPPPSPIAPPVLAVEPPPKSEPVTRTEPPKISPPPMALLPAPALSPPPRDPIPSEPASPKLVPPALIFAPPAAPPIPVAAAPVLEARIVPPLLQVPPPVAEGPPPAAKILIPPSALRPPSVAETSRKHDPVPAEEEKWRVASRHLGLGERKAEALLRRLRQEKRAGMTLRVPEGHPEIFETALAVKELFLAAGWRVPSVQVVADGRLGNGWVLCTGAFPPPSEVTTIFTALTTAGFKISTDLDPNQRQPRAVLYVTSKR